MLKKMLMCFCLFAYMLGVSAGTDGVVEDNKKGDVAVKNLTRAMTLLDNTIDKCFKGSDLHMCDLYHLDNGRQEGTADVWPYTAAMEAVNGVMEALQTLKGNCPELYAKNMERYKCLMARLFDNLDYYKGTYTLTSYTQTKEWSVYGVHRSNTKGTAKVEGIENVYEDRKSVV